uniref:Uncharacterized protein n=1 Tax=Glossina morsitans morsitans TaxID=37546 RepID=A0A1B0G4A6_GLOMM
MLEYFNFLAMFRKRRRFNGDDGNGDNSGNNYSLFNNLIGSCNFLFGVSSNDFDRSSDIGICVDTLFNLNESFVTVLDELDARVEKFRKHALDLQEKCDFLRMFIDKSNEFMQNLRGVNARLSTVERDRSLDGQMEQECLLESWGRC